MNRWVVLIPLLGIEWIFPLIIRSDSNTPFYRYSVMTHFGNISGIGMGGRVNLNRIASAELLMGAIAPFSPGFSIPYAGNEFNILLRSRLIHPRGIYLTAGWYWGYFNITGYRDGVEVNKAYLKHGAAFSVGWEYPARNQGKTLSLEFGTVLNLPKYLFSAERTYQGNYSLEAWRSHRSMDQFFPFLTLIVKL